MSIQYSREIMRSIFYIITIIIYSNRRQFPWNIILLVLFVSIQLNYIHKPFPESWQTLLKYNYILCHLLTQFNLNFTWGLKKPLSLILNVKIIRSWKVLCAKGVPTFLETEFVWHTLNIVNVL